MAINRVVVVLFFAFALAKAELQTLKGSVTCLDCPQVYDLSGIQVLVKCDKVKKLAMAYTEGDGTFQTEPPSDGPDSSTNPSNCMAKIMGGPQLIYTSAKDSLIPFAKSKDSSHNYFTLSKPLSFYKTCPLKGKCGGNDMGFGSSKTVDLPLPREWGLAPSSYYIPFVPIIGIP
ncbi:hypothetical protein PHJA_001370500 [Phtheirospermum japonicum]|uniref:Uncharacterized protein n=1 Tax=Phtheirospermum japonicum TaxID=374723 RepID=A0A830C7B4_9LAMI|nr:hypothetical protein PHJA_001370500 [Phtheirospermum japonicum]